MFRPAKVKRILFIGLKKIEKKLIDALHESGLVDIDYADIEGVNRAKPDKTLDEISGALTKIRAVMKELAIKEKKRGIYLDWKEAVEEFNKKGISEKLSLLLEEEEKTKERLKELRERLAIIDVFAKNDIDLESIRPKSLYLLAGRMPLAKKQRLEKIENIYILEDQDNDKGNDKQGNKQEKKEYVYFIIASKENINLPEAEFFDYVGDAKKQKKELEQEISSLEEKLNSINEQKELIKKNEAEFLRNAKATLSVIAERASIVSRFAETENIFVIEGWIKEKDIEQLEELIEKKFKNLVYFETFDDENAPTVLENPRAVNNFEFLVEFFSLPKSYEIDPTIILFFTFPILYGMMVGDVFYSIISFLIAGFIAKKFKGSDLERLGKVWQISSIAGIFFGVLFDEWLGFTHEHLFHILREYGIPTPEHALYHGISRVHDVNTLILLSVAVGYVYILLGFILGFINEFNHNKKHAIAKAGWIAMLLAPLGSFITINLSIGLGLVGLAMVFYGEGIAGVFEIGTVIGNILSFARIAAVGIAGVILAEIINEFIPLDPGLSLLWAIPLLILLHFMNTGLAMFESTIQGGRLNLVEMYSKFYHGGGKRFTPFYIYSKR